MRPNRPSLPRKPLLAATAAALCATALGAPSADAAGTRAVAPATRAVAAATRAVASSAAPAAASTSLASTLPAFAYSSKSIDSALAYRMRYTWRSGCPVPLSSLRYLRMTYFGFDGYAHTGEMVVHYAYVSRIVGVFHRLYDNRFPIRRMRLVDDYYGSDSASMDANNASSFNCRKKTSGTGWSIHSYGKAIDINPVQNPYVNGSTVEPAAGTAYVDRWPLQKGMVNWTVRDSFADIGWYWGGNWRTVKDYQHFSYNGY